MIRIARHLAEAAAIAFAATVLIETAVEAAVSGLCPTARTQISALAKKQSAILQESAVQPRGPVASIKDEKAMRKVAEEFNRALAEGDAEKIWKDLIPKNSRGAVAVAMGSDPDSGEFSVEIYRTVKGFPEGRKVIVEGFRDSLKGGLRRPEIERMQVVGKGDIGAVFVKYKGGKYLPVIVVKSNGSWKVDLATMVSMGKKNLIRGAASSAKDLVIAERTDAADDLLRDALSLESAFRRASKEPLRSSIDRNARASLGSQLGDFKVMKSLLEGISPKA